MCYPDCSPDSRDVAKNEHAADNQSVTLADHLRASKNALIFTGAGVSTGSGIPDFRGPQGVWTRRQPVYFQDFMTSEAARIEHWDYKLEGRDAFRDARPNTVHHAIVRLERAGKLRCVITQNIDGLHSLAGTSAERLVGSTEQMLWSNARPAHWRGDPGRISSDFSDRLANRRSANAADSRNPPPSASVRILTRHELERAGRQRWKPISWLRWARPYRFIRRLPFRLLRRNAAFATIVINRGATDHDGEQSVTLRLEGEVSEAVPSGC